MTSGSLCPGQQVVMARMLSGWVGESVEASMSCRLNILIRRLPAPPPRGRQGPRSRHYRLLFSLL